MKVNIGVVVGLVFLSIGIASGEVRTWTDTSGKFKLEAEFVALEDGEVTLRSATGEIKKLPLEKLSAANRKLAAELAAADKAKLANEESIAALEKLGGEFTYHGKVLNLGGSKITDAGLVHLKGLTGLRTLLLTDTRVTDAGVKKFKAALPKCRILD
jgi:hypothetical protein